MAIKMVREPSETPNINNIDDIVPMRYAYGNQNGYVIGKGNEISNTVNGLNFTVNSGRLVLQGVECDIDAVGVTITIDNIATKRYYVIYLEVNLGLNTATIKNEYDTATYPSIDAGDDLTANTTGIARLPLYRFTATSGVISEVNKVVESVKYTKDIKINNAIEADNATSAKNGIYFKSFSTFQEFINWYQLNINNVELYNFQASCNTEVSSNNNTSIKYIYSVRNNTRLDYVDAKIDFIEFSFRIYNSETYKYLGNVSFRVSDNSEYYASGITTATCEFFSSGIKVCANLSNINNYYYSITTLFNIEIDSMENIKVQYTNI